MKIIFPTDEAPESFIDLKDVDTTHLIVAIVEQNGFKYPTILGKGFEENWSDLSFLMLTDKNNRSVITRGNGFSFDNADDTPSKMLIALRKAYPLSKMAAFEQKDWKKALKFLIDNG